MYNREMDLNEIVVFTRVVQAKSFRAAAHELEMPASTVSAKVAGLERRLGVTLIRRTTRKLFVTTAGQAYFDRCLIGLGEISAAESAVQNEQTEPHGKLRVTAPVELGRLVLGDLTARYVKLYPKVKVELVLSDAHVDLVGEGIDLALRSGKLQDSSLVAKRIGFIYFALMASAAFVKAQKSVRQPRDLSSVPCLPFAPLGVEHWDLTNRKTKLRIALNARIAVNDLSTVKSLALSGLGVALLPNFLCEAEAKSGKLVRILPEWHSRTTPIHLVYPAQKFVSPALRAYVDLAGESLRSWMERLS